MVYFYWWLYKCLIVHLLNNFFWFQFSKIQYWKNLTLHCLLSVCGAVYYKAKACFQAILLCTQVTRSDLEIILTVASLYPVDVWTSAPHHSHHCLRLGWGHIKHWHKNNPLIWSTIFQKWWPLIEFLVYKDDNHCNWSISAEDEAYQ